MNNTERLKELIGLCREVVALEGKADDYVRTEEGWEELHKIEAFLDRYDAATTVTEPGRLYSDGLDDIHKRFIEEAMRAWFADESFEFGFRFRRIAGGQIIVTSLDYHPLKVETLEELIKDSQ